MEMTYGVQTFLPQKFLHFNNVINWKNEIHFHRLLTKVKYVGNKVQKFTRKTPESYF